MEWRERWPKIVVSRRTDEAVELLQRRCGYSAAYSRFSIARRSGLPAATYEGPWRRQSPGLPPYRRRRCKAEEAHDPRLLVLNRQLAAALYPDHPLARRGRDGT
ncbi:hypothetical protein MDOR_17720 [Mycolicibacterium doricum]|uniref:Uncharacterized protein n=1 Tax=Mycolicibacterium doricum TaxID=126673 RepID=A0A7I7VU18_9MYCO|nr:hypothetical protein MDOR_17720 [Mycolicibacterium doricum]